MKYDPGKHHRRSIRLKGYDYSQPGAFFVTIVTFQRARIFGEVVGGRVRPSAPGRIADECWRAIPEHFVDVRLDAYVIMPDHMHGIIQITEQRGEVLSPPLKQISPRPDKALTPRMDETTTTLDGGRMPDTGRGTRPPLLVMPTLGQIIAYYKYQSTSQMNLLDGSGVITKFWQRGYHERIIRNVAEWDRIRRYIDSNPARWIDDRDRGKSG